MKKLLSVILSVLVVCSFAFFAIGSGSSEETTDDQGTQAAGNASVEETEAADGNNIGNVNIEIKESRFTQTYDYKDVIVVKYAFTNNGEEAAAFYTTVTDKAYQNGIELEKAYILIDGDPYDDSNESKEIKKGVTLEVEIPYILNDAAADVEVEVEDWLGLSDKKVTKIFTIE